MKKNIFLLIALTLFTGSISAQYATLNGVWKLIDSYEYEGETYSTSMNITFKAPDLIEISGRNLGTWVQNESENTLTIQSDNLFEDIQGENKIETLNDTELQLLNSNGETTIFQRMSLPEGKALTNKFTGEWLLEKVEVDGHTEFVGQIMDFNSNGILYAQGMIFGTWNYNKASENIVFEITEEKDKMNGTHAIIKATETLFSIDVDGATLYFLKMDYEKIAKENRTSGFIGTWKLKDEDQAEEITILKFDAPNTFIYVVKTEYSKQKGRGMWIFSENDKTVLLLGGLEQLGGLNKVMAIKSNEMSLENNGTTYVLEQEVEYPKEIEHLTYTQDDFFTKNGDYEDFKYPDNTQKLPWKDNMELMMTLVNVKQLVYSYSTLIESVNVFENETLTANVNSNPQEQQLSIDFIFNGYDRYNLPEDAELPPNEFDEYNSLYPEEDNIFRVVTTEKITTAAGTFDCTVIESVDGWDHSKKLWMINDKPGVYAKIIDENRDENFGYYHHRRRWLVPHRVLPT